MTGFVSRHMVRRLLEYSVVLLLGGMVAGGFAGLLMAVIYLFLVFLPGFVWVIDEGWVEGFVLANIIGFSFVGVSVGLELFFGLPLSAPVFLVVPLLFLTIGVWVRYFS